MDFPCPPIKWGRYATTLVIMLLFLLPHWASPLPVGLGCSPPKLSLDWGSPFKFFHANHWHLATPYKRKKPSLSLCPFLLHCLGQYSCPKSRSPCSEMLNFLLTDSWGNSHWFTKLCFEKQYLKLLVSVNENLPAVFFFLLWSVILFCVWLSSQESPLNLIVIQLQTMRFAS